MGEWIECNADGCPLRAVGQTVMIRFADGTEHGPTCADMWDWREQGDLAITGYSIAEHDELQQAVWRLDGDKLMLEAERDSLRAEVEQLNAMVEAMCRLDYERFLEIERLRKGRGDGKIADADCAVHDRNTLGLQLSYGGAGTLDPRLGMPQPEGEPVGPRPIRRWMP